MNDEFLHLLREEPNPAFEQRLWQRLSTLSSNEGITSVTTYPRTRRFVLRPIVALVGAVALTTSVAAAASPQVRDAISDLFHQVGSQLYHEQESPNIVGVDTRVIEKPADEPAPQPQPQELPEEGSGLPVGFKQAIDTQRRAGFDFPAMVPPGYRPEQTATANAGKPQGISEFRWHDESGRTLIFTTVVRPEGSNPGVFPVGPGALTEVEVNGYAGALIRGDWDDRGQWDADAGIRLRWNKGSVEYQLIADDPSMSPELLMEIASSAHGNVTP